MTAPSPRLRTRIMLAFASLTLLVAAVFGVYAVSAVYVIEDRFFDAMLQREAALQLRHRAQQGDWSSARDPAMRVYPNAAALPRELRAVLAEDPQRREIAGGDGRHYHLLPLQPRSSEPTAYLVAEVSRQLVVRPIRQDLFALLGWSALALVVMALVVGGWLAHRTATPIAQLAAQVQALRPDQPPTGWSSGYRDHEVGVLARGLEGLATRVRALVTREREFTRDASHELRTPLAVIRSVCERLQQEPLTDAGRHQVAFLRQSAQQLEQTVAALLALAREDAPAAASTGSTAHAVLPILEAVVMEQAAWLQDKPVTVVVDVPRDARVRLAEPVLRVLLSNLVGNAFVHADHGCVHIDVADGRLRIRNPGELAATVRDNPFQPFAKSEASAGQGLGLAIVRRLCDRHGVDVRIDAVEGMVSASFALASGPVISHG